jgi:hypothetical protein
MTTERKEDPEKPSELGALMKRLPRQRAPWHFEARLKQRLAAGNDRRGSFVQRPVFLLPIAGAAAAVALYLLLPPSGDVVPGLLPPSNSPEQPGSTQDQIETTPEAKTIPENQEQDAFTSPGASPGRGPSSGSSDSFQPARITLQNSSPSIPSTAPLLTPATETADSGLYFLFEPDSADTARNPPDSLEKEE